VTRLSWFSSAAVLRSLWRARGAMLAFSLLVQSACLIPQQIVELGADAGPHPAPYFVLAGTPDYLLTPILTLNRQGPADAVAATPCVCHLNLSVPSVFEEDTSVTLQSRWFVDYDKSIPTSQTLQDFKSIPGNFNAQDPVRPVPPFTFNADSLGIVSNGVHIVEVVVGDLSGFDDSADAGVRFRSMKPTYESALYRIAVQVNVTQDPNQPHCAVVQEYQQCGP
jgi:hypothetical protein